MSDKLRPLREAYSLLERAAPLGRDDCGLICEKECCTDSLGDSMELFPGEKELLGGVDGFEITENGGAQLLCCSGRCDRKTRPLACRIYPLFPLVSTDNNGKEKIRVIYDPRATAACPLCAQSEKLDRVFVRAVRRAGLYLLESEEAAEYLRKTSDYLIELMQLKYRLSR